MRRKVPPADWRPVGVSELEPAADWAVRSTLNTVIIAGPGAGKTEMLAQRACFLLQTDTCPYPHRILAISFKRDAAKNLADRVTQRVGKELGARFDSYTFDAFAKGLVDRFRMGLPGTFRPTADFRPDFDLEKAGPLRDLLENCAGAESGYTFADLQGINASRFYENHICGTRIDVSGAQSAGTTGALVHVFWRRVLERQVPSPLSFRMINRLAEATLRLNPKVLAALRSTYRYVFLDEFQDTTSLQYDLLSTAFEGTETVLTAVGDPKQRIMLWAGALEGIFARFSDDFAAVPKHLKMNWRSAPRLVEIQRRMIAMLDEDAEPPEWPPHKADEFGECRMLRYSTHEHEAADLAARIAGWISTDKLSPRDVCVLTRNRPDAYTEMLRGALASIGISARVENEFQDLLAEPLVDLMINFLALGTTSKSPDAWQSVVEEVLSLSGLDEGDDSALLRISELSAYLKDFKGRVFATSAEVCAIKLLLDGLIDFVGRPALRLAYPQYEYGQYFDELVDKCALHLAAFRAETGDWASAVRAFIGRECVPIMTIHKSKGLEYHTVIFVGLEDDAFWNFRNNAQEESCGFFVAFSRAKTRVVFTFSIARPNARTGSLTAQTRRSISSFYDLLEGAGVVVETVASGE